MSNKIWYSQSARDNLMPLSAFLSDFPLRDGLHFISEPRAFQHPEEDYDQQYGIDRLQLDEFRREGEAIFGLCEEHGLRDSGPALEIGCGTGRLSVSLLLSGRMSEFLLTDPSPAFCAITARKLAALELLPRFSMGVLSAEDMQRLPVAFFSLVILRSVLHHIIDIPEFFRQCARVLAPGGLLIFEEPCQEGYVLMGAMTQIIPDLLAARGVELSEAQQRRIQIFVDAMQFYARRDLDKSQAEDKHLFRPDELMRIAGAAQMDLQFVPNRTLKELDFRREPLPPDYFERFYFDYLKYCMSWEGPLLDLFSTHVRRYFQYFSCLATGNALPHTYGTFLCKKL